jgi:hypothetical protein
MKKMRDTGEEGKKRSKEEKLLERSRLRDGRRRIKKGGKDQIAIPEIQSKAIDFPWGY